MRWLVVGIVVTVVLGAAVAYQRMARVPEVRATSEVTDYGMRRAAQGDLHRETATFAAGCFWKIEHALRGVDGVISTAAGYTGGADESEGDSARGPAARVNHFTVSSGRTGHAEAVRVVFDPTRVSFDQLLDVFWASHDPTRFSAEPGEPPAPGRSEIYYHSEAQREAAESSLRRLQAGGQFPQPISTVIRPATVFHRAEDEHQQYLEKHGRPRNSSTACRIR